MNTLTLQEVETDGSPRVLIVERSERQRLPVHENGVVKNIMTKVQLTLVVGLCLLSGFVGGFAGARLTSISPAFAADTNTTVRARSFDLVDSTGRLLGRFGQDPHRAPGLFLYDANGSDRVDVVLSPKLDAPGIYLSDEHHFPAIGLTVTEDGRPGAIFVRGSEGAVLGFNTNGEPGLTFFSHGVNRSILRLGKTGAPSLRFFDAKGSAVYSQH